jgi:recombinational DNA repair protein RecT
MGHHNPNNPQPNKETTVNNVSTNTKQPPKHSEYELKTMFKEKIMGLLPKLQEIYGMSESEGLTILLDIVGFIASGEKAAEQFEKMLEVPKSSFLEVISVSRKLGLPIDGRRLVYPIVYGKTIKLQVGKNGYAQLIQRKHPHAHIETGIVFKGDTFTDWKESGQAHYKLIAGENGSFRNDYNNAVGAYCFLAYEQGGRWFSLLEKISANELDVIRSKSKMKGYGPWVEFQGEMMRKTTINRMGKAIMAMTLSAEEAQVLSHINEEEYDMDAPPAITRKASMAAEPSSLQKAIDRERAAMNQVAEVIALEHQPMEVMDVMMQTITEEEMAVVRQENLEASDSYQALVDDNPDELWEAKPSAEDVVIVSSDPLPEPMDTSLHNGLDHPPLSEIRTSPSDTPSAWDGKTIVVGKDTQVHDFPNAVFAGEHLLKMIESRPTAAMRQTLYADNDALILALSFHGKEGIALITKLSKVILEDK